MPQTGVVWAGFAALQSHPLSCDCGFLAPVQARAIHISWGSEPQHSRLHRSSCMSPRNVRGLEGLTSCLPDLSPC